MWEECFGYADRGCIVRGQFLVKDVQIDGFRLGEIEGSLDTRVDEDAVKIGVLRNDFGGKLWDLWFRWTLVGVYLSLGMSDFTCSSCMMSNAFAETLFVPYRWTISSRFSFLRPATINFDPFWTTLSASVLPIPEVAPMIRTFLYPKAIMGTWSRCENMTKKNECFCYYFQAERFLFIQLSEF